MGLGDARHLNTVFAEGGGAVDGGGDDGGIAGGGDFLIPGGEGAEGVDLGAESGNFGVDLFPRGNFFFVALSVELENQPALSPPCRTRADSRPDRPSCPRIALG